MPQLFEHVLVDVAAVGLAVIRAAAAGRGAGRSPAVIVLAVDGRDDIVGLRAAHARGAAVLRNSARTEPRTSPRRPAGST